MRFVCAIVIVSVFVALVGCSDVVQSNHVTLAAAKEDIQKGWIPAVLPPSTVKIRESHDLDTITGHGTFVFDKKDVPSFRAALTQLSPDTQIWRVPREKMEGEGYSFYKHGDFFIAVNWSSCRGEFWLV